MLLELFGGSSYAATQVKFKTFDLALVFGFVQRLIEEVILLVDKIHAAKAISTSTTTAQKSRVRAIMGIL